MDHGQAYPAVDAGARAAERVATCSGPWPARPRRRREDAAARREKNHSCALFGVQCVIVPCTFWHHIAGRVLVTHSEETIAFGHLVRADSSPCAPAKPIPTSGVIGFVICAFHFACEVVCCMHLLLHKAGCASLDGHMTCQEEGTWPRNEQRSHVQREQRKHRPTRREPRPDGEQKHT